MGITRSGSLSACIRLQQISPCISKSPKGLLICLLEGTAVLPGPIPFDIEPVSTAGLQSCPQGTGVIAHRRGPQAGLFVSQCVSVFQSVYPEPTYPSVSLKQTKVESQPPHLFTMSALLPCCLGLFPQPFLMMTFLPTDTEQINVSYADQ